MGSPVPSVDERARRRLRARFGNEIDPRLEELPALLAALGERWGLEFGPLIPQGSMSVVIRCDTADGRSAVLKVAPDRARLGMEADALATWATPHVPVVHAVDAGVGALLMEAIEPGGMLRDASRYPAMESVAELLTSLHSHGSAGAAFPPLTHRIAYLFDSWAGQRQLHPELVELVPEDLFARGRAYAARLAAQRSPTALLHGDLTPVNVLDGGDRRGLVAIDPAPCLGDPAYDAIDLLVWQAGDVATIEARAARLATAIDADVARLIDWCLAFASMFVLDLWGAGDNWRDRAAPLLSLASQVPRS